LTETPPKWPTIEHDTLAGAPPPPLTDPLPPAGPPPPDRRIGAGMLLALAAIKKRLTDAVSSIQAAHLRLIYLRYPVTSRAQAAKIVQQSPLAGNTAPGNAQVLVYLGAIKG
jgi:hypothetical protein